MSQIQKRIGRSITLCSGALLMLAFAASPIHAVTPDCANNNGNLVIHVNHPNAKKQLVDCELAGISKANFKITWVANPKETIDVDFNKDGSPFLNFSCKKANRCTASQLDPNALHNVVFHYSVHLDATDGPHDEDPGVIIQP